LAAVVQAVVAVVALRPVSVAVVVVGVALVALRRRI
jgi:hypothetical protein